MTDKNRYSLDESWEFWKPLVTDAAGNIRLEAVKSELHDFYVALQEVPKVYCHITGDRLSKINYSANVVIAEADAHYEELYTEEGEK